MNIIPSGMNSGATHPIQVSSHTIQAAQQMQPMSHVMHGGQAMGIPMQNAMGGHTMHAMSGGGIHMQQPTGVMGSQQPHMQLLHGNQMVQVQAMQQPQGTPQAVPAVVEEVDPVTKAKNLLPQLKESLNILNSDFVKSILSFSPSENDGHNPAQLQLDQSLLDFYSVCDQMELNLKLVAETLQQGSESRKYFPFNVHEVPVPPGQTAENVAQYHQYSNVVESQVMYAQEVRELLTSRARKFKEQNPQSHPPPAD